MVGVQTATKSVHELGPIFAVAVGVALVTTLVGSMLASFHQVAAEDLAVRSGAATAGPDASTQTLVLGDWNAQLNLPLTNEMPLVAYAEHSASSLGLSSADAAKLGPDCLASRNALGSVLRSPLGTYARSAHHGPIEYFIAAIGSYEYTYQMPQTACADTPLGQALVNRETSFIISSLDSLAPTTH